jgi:hypothetical protein
MPGRFDATLKILLDLGAADWLQWLAPLIRLPAATTLDPVALDTDLSTVQPAPDKVFRLQPSEYGLLHIEPQANHDARLGERLLRYNVLLAERHKVPVHSVAVLLRREADSPAITGTVTRSRADGSVYHSFEYGVVRLWQVVPETLLRSGLGTLPLALLTDFPEERLPRLVEEFVQKTKDQAVTAAAAQEVLSYGYILMGLRYNPDVVRKLFDGGSGMRESSTYQAILAEGIVTARQQDILLILERRFGTVPDVVREKVLATTDQARLQQALCKVHELASPEELPL